MALRAKSQRVRPGPHKITSPSAATTLTPLPGRAIGPSTRQEAASLLEILNSIVMTKGSARVALEIEPQHSIATIFIEKRQAEGRVRSKHLKSEFPSRPVGRILNEDANAAVERICSDSDCAQTGRSCSSTQYWMQVSWETLVAVAATESDRCFGCSTRQAWA